MESELESLKAEVRDVVDERLHEDVRVEFVEQGNRLDVRVRNLGVAGELESLRENVSATPYSEYQFTVMLD